MEWNKSVSIIIPTYNRAELIIDTIESILIQTFNDWELIIVDDGSTDNTIAVIEEYSKKDNRVNVLTRNREPKGPSTCKNIGAENARGAYFIFWDSDDIMTPWCLENRVSFMVNNPDLDFAFFQILSFDEFNKTVSLRINTDGSGDDVDKFIEFNHGGSTQTTIWKKSGFESSGWWNIDNVGYEDTDIHLKAILKGLKYKFGSQIPDGLLRDAQRPDRLTVDGHSLQTGDKALSLFNSISGLLNNDKREIFKKNTLTKVWSKGFGLSNNAVNQLGLNAIEVGLFNKTEYKHYIIYFKLWKHISKVPLLRRFFYLPVKKKYNLDKKHTVKKLDDKTQMDLHLFASNISKEIMEKFFKTLPAYLKPYFTKNLFN
jgi:glycosyltransferase involved in cell wall biosynthesis